MGTPGGFWEPLATSTLALGKSPLTYDTVCSVIQGPVLFLFQGRIKLSAPPQGEAKNSASWLQESDKEGRQLLVHLRLLRVTIINNNSCRELNNLFHPAKGLSHNLAHGWKYATSESHPLLLFWEVWRASTEGAIGCQVTHGFLSKPVIKSQMSIVAIIYIK